MSEFIWGFATDKGKFREKNQDRVFCHAANICQGNFLLACVCDGIGSFEYSEEASEIVAQGLQLWTEGLVDNKLSHLSSGELAEDLFLTILELNRLIYEKQKRERIQLGCTMSLLLIIADDYYIYHAGDSRIYKGFSTLRQITADEIVVSKLDGKKRLSNCIGYSAYARILQFAGKIKNNDIFIIGSDGMFNKQDVTNYGKEIAQITSCGSMERLCADYMQRARNAGERDNISCAIVRIKKTRFVFFRKEKHQYDK